jgi:translocation and assembly module TamB
LPLIRKIIKISLWIIGSLLFLVLVIALSLNSQWGQNIVRGKAETFLTDKLKTEVRVGFLGVGFPKYILIRNVFVRDQAHDTLLSLRELKADLDMLALIRGKVDVPQLVLTGVHSHVYRKLHDTDFNFTYIINAFAGDKSAVPSTPKDTTAKPLNINVGKVTLDDIHVRYDDYTGGTLLAVDLAHLSLRMKELDLDKMKFHVKELSVAGLQGSFTQDTSYLPVQPKTSGQTDVQLIADDVDLQKIAFKYADNTAKLHFAVNLGSLNLQLNKFGLADNLVDIKKLSVDSTSMSLHIGKALVQPATPDNTKIAAGSAGWNVSAGDIAMNSIAFRMDNDNSPPISKGIDYAHLNLKGIELKLKDAKYSTDKISGNLAHLAASEQSGLQLKELKTVFSYNSQGAVLNKLYLETPNTLLQDHLEVHYTSIDSIATQLAAMQVQVNLKNGRIGVSDILLFVPGLDSQEIFRQNKDAQFTLAAKLNGTVGDLNISLLEIAGLNNTEVLLSGKLTGLPDPDKLFYDLNIAKFQSSARDVALFVPDSTLATVRTPDQFMVVGQLSGTISDFNTNINVTSTDGLAYVRGSLAMSPDKGHERYYMVISTADLNLGHIFRQDSTLGPVSARFVIKGMGFDPRAMMASVDGKLISAMVMGYRYHDISLYGKLADQKGNINLMSSDPNVQLQMEGTADFSGKYVAAKADIRIDSIDLQALKLYTSEFRLRGTMHADFPVFNPDFPEGRFTWWDPVLTVDGKRFYMDSLYVISRPGTDGSQHIVADMGVLQATITGKIPLSQIAPAIQDHISRHYTYATGDTAMKTEVKNAKTPSADYTLNVEADIVDKPMLRGLLPDLTSFESIHLTAALSPRLLNVDLTVPDLVYGGTSVENCAAHVRGSDSAFTYQLTVGKFGSNQYALGYTDIHGRVADNTITTNLSISDFQGNPRFALAASMQQLGDSQVIHLLPGLKLDYNNWEVTQPNRIVLHKGGFYTRNFEISDSGQYIRANSTEARINSPMKVDIHNFMLSNITRAISTNDTLLAGGLLSGTVDVQQLFLY